MSTATDSMGHCRKLRRKVAPHYEWWVDGPVQGHAESRGDSSYCWGAFECCALLRTVKIVRGGVRSMVVGHEYSGNESPGICLTITMRMIDTSLDVGRVLRPGSWGFCIPSYCLHLT